jgi:mono/diheme cytochrome c family protein
MKKLVSVAVVALACSAGAAGAQTAMERGTYLVRGIVGCGNCHTPQGPEGPVAGMEFAGQKVIEEPAFIAYAPNITPDPETGIGHYTRDDLKRAIREGKRPDGTIIGPPMPIGLYRGLSDNDLDAIVTYVMSVAPVRNVVPKSEYRIPLPPNYGPPVSGVADVERSDKVAYGKYMAFSLGHCVECHTPPGPNGVPDFAGQLGAGGFEFEGPWGLSISANITPHADGIAHYTDAELKKIIQTGIRPDGTHLLPPMGVSYYATINDEDMGALVAYLRTMEPKPFGGK